ncbi:hypothetical protein MBLNU459_g0886t1 [Dothideomycetes sp. NU459]
MSSIDADSPNWGQLSNLRGVATHITGHDSSTGKAVVQESRPGSWTVYDGNEMAFNVVYTSSFNSSVNRDVDIKAHDDLISSKKLGLVNPAGTVCRIVDFAPGYQCIMHRTQSIDYGIILEGTIEMVLDSGATQLMRRGDVAVQRATMHAWRNTSTTEWARMIFVLQACQKVTIAGEECGEDLGDGIEGLPASGASV